MSGLPTDIILDIILLGKVTVEHRDIVDNTSDKQKKHQCHLKQPGQTRKHSAAAEEMHITLRSQTAVMVSKLAEKRSQKPTC